MEDEEEVLSDVHAFIHFEKADSDSKGSAVITAFSKEWRGAEEVYTRFHVRCHLDDNDDDDDDNNNDDDLNHGLPDPLGNIPCDDEGDYVIRRKKDIHHSSGVITIEHQLATGLKDVGLQVWRGALLMADFIFDNEQMFTGCCGMELGAGVGLCSIVLGRVASQVFCTEIGHEAILKNCQRNVEINSHLYRNARMQESGDFHPVVKVRQLDWTKECLPEDESIYGFGWNKEDKDELQKVTVMIAADVIYDDHLTDAFFKKVISFFQNNVNTVLYLAIEKRLNFTLEFLEVSCPAYNHFINTLQKLESEYVLQSRKIPATFDQYLDYERVKELELWEIKPC